MTEPLFPCTIAVQTPNPPFCAIKTAVPKFPQNGGSTPTPCLDKAVHAQGGGGYKTLHCVHGIPSEWSDHDALPGAPPCRTACQARASTANGEAPLAHDQGRSLQETKAHPDGRVNAAPCSTRLRHLTMRQELPKHCRITGPVRPQTNRVTLWGIWFLESGCCYYH